MPELFHTTRLLGPDHCRPWQPEEYVGDVLMHISPHQLLRCYDQSLDQFWTRPIWYRTNCKSVLRFHLGYRRDSHPVMLAQTYSHKTSFINHLRTWPDKIQPWPDGFQPRQDQTTTVCTICMSYVMLMTLALYTTTLCQYSTRPMSTYHKSFLW